MALSVEEVLGRLSQRHLIHVTSTSDLVVGLEKAAGAIDRKRKRSGRNDESHRKSALEPVRGEDRSGLATSPWELLATLARATTLARHGRGRGLAEHWQSLKYCQALAAVGAKGYLALTDEGQSPERSYRAMQAVELGRAVGLTFAERTIRNQLPDHLITTMDAEAVLLAGFARAGSQPTLGTRPRPDYFIEAWQPGRRSHVFLVTVNGNHQVATPRTSKADRSVYRQLARSSERAEHLHLGDWNTTPCHLISTELLAKEGITVNALQAPGHGLLPDRSADGRASADVSVSERNLTYTNTVQLPRPQHEVEGEPRFHDAFFVPRKELGWFGQVLARTAAAGQLAFAGAGQEVARYLTPKQGRRHYEQRTFAGSSSVHDARHKFGPTLFVGTDQVFRLNGIRVEAFSGMAAELYELLAKGEVERYRRRAYDLRATWPMGTTAPGWGPTSFRDDGTVMALRILTGQPLRESTGD